MMPRTSSSRTPSKRKRASPRTPAGAAKKTTAKHKALRAAKADPVVTQELKGAYIPTAIPTIYALPFLPAAEWLGFMSRAASKSFALPLAMMRCRTPLEAWVEQNKLLQHVFTDFQKVSARAMNSAFNGAAGEARDTTVKKRRRTRAS